VQTKRLRTVKHRQVGNERANLIESLESRNLVSDVELELVVEDGIGKPDLYNKTTRTHPLLSLTPDAVEQTNNDFLSLVTSTFDLLTPK